VKPELLLDPQPNPDGEGEVTTYDFVLDPEV
jgi:catechol 1,2-dioxygenase